MVNLGASVVQSQVGGIVVLLAGNGQRRFL
jgi:hypothetical protein